MQLLRKYGVAATFLIPVIKAGANDFAASADWTPAAGDVQVSKDDGAFANVTTLPTAVGNMWKVSLSATEMQAARLAVQIVDAATKAVEDQAVLIETCGHASAQHAFDLDAATVTLAAGIHTGAVIPTVTTVGTCTANSDMRGTDNALTAVGYTAPDNAGIASIQTDTGTTLPATLATITAYVDELESRLTALRAGYLDNLNGHTPQTADHTAALTAIQTQTDRLGFDASSNVHSTIRDVDAATGADALADGIGNRGQTISGGTLTVNKRGGGTLYTQTVTTDPAADPVTGLS
jgi:hypothetical protein